MPVKTVSTKANNKIFKPQSAHRADSAKEQTMKNAVIYARFSSHAQNEQSIEGQLAECYNFAQRNDLRITHEYIDRALTGTTDQTPRISAND